MVCRREFGDTKGFESYKAYKGRASFELSVSVDFRLSLKEGVDC